MNFEILEKHRFQFLNLVSFLNTGCPAKSRKNFNDHSNLIHVINGSGKIFFGFESYPLIKGTVIALPPFVECYFEYGAVFEMRNIHYNLWDKDGELIDDLKRLPIVFKPDYFDYCESLLNEMKNLKPSPSPDSLKTASMAHALVIRHYSSNQLTSSDSYPHDERIRKLYKMLKSPKCMEYDAHKMAKACFLSVSQMNRKFKECFRESPRRFWEKNRFNNICHALTDTGKPLAEITVNFAFAYQSHFSKWFKNIAKIPPAEYRKKYSGKAGFRM